MSSFLASASVLCDTTVGRLPPHPTFQLCGFAVCCPLAEFPLLICRGSWDALFLPQCLAVIPTQEAKAKGPSGEVDSLQQKLQRINQELDAANKVCLESHVAPVSSAPDLHGRSV